MPYIPAKIRFRILEKHGYSCAYCGKRPPEVSLEIDHVIPVSREGPDAEDNLAPACAFCNIGKGDRIASELTEAAVTEAKGVGTYAGERSTTKERRMVRLCYGTMAANGGFVGMAKLWAFGMDTLAEFFGVSKKTIKRWMNDPVAPLDPADLHQVMGRYWARKK